mmetsp:Transcript_18668/g.56425  ORF Transcript_18668/g.56425 Transcript_18668/m.56425 type:complete len:447 (-) Transcript_18668:375-1715(-)
MTHCATHNARLCSPMGAVAGPRLQQPVVQQQFRTRSCGAAPQILPNSLQFSGRNVLSAGSRRSCGQISVASRSLSGSPFDRLDRGAFGESWDVLGLGQAMVDTSACVSDEFLHGLDVDKGARRVISLEERASILQQLGGSAYQVSAGGSLSNTLLALARLGAAEHALHGRGTLRVAMDGIIGGDPLSEFYHSQMQRAGVKVLARPSPASCTGTVMVLTTPDANRTMLSYLGTPAPVVLDPALTTAIARARMLVIEGYVWEMPGAAESITAAIEVAHAHGTLIALTAGDMGCVMRNRKGLWAALHAGVDIIFTNKSEAAALVGEPCDAKGAALALGPHADMVVVTDGADGSCISALGRLHVVPPHWTTNAPIDTCGAGDAYAAGVLWAYLRGQGVSAMGRAGARVASQIINRQGATLTEESAAELASVLPLVEASPALTSLSSADMW